MVLPERIYTTPTRRGQAPLMPPRVISGVTPLPGENLNGPLKRSFIGWTLYVGVLIRGSLWRPFLPQSEPGTGPPTWPASTVPILPFSRARAEGGVHDGHGLELAGRQELLGGYDRREPRARDGQPSRSGHRQRAPDWATLHDLEAHARLTYAGGGSSVARGLGPWVSLSRNPCP